MRLRRLLRASLLGATFLACLEPRVADAGEYRKADQSKVTFHAVGPGGLKIEGVTSELEFVETDQSLIVTVPLKNLTTGIDLRDRHMKEKYLEIDKYPNVVLVVDKASVRFPKPGEHFKHSANGTVEIHGIKRPVSVGYEVERSNRGTLIVGNFPVNVKHHNIEVPSYLGVTVKPDLTVTATFHLEQ